MSITRAEPPAPTGNPRIGRCFLALLLVTALAAPTQTLAQRQGGGAAGPSQGGGTGSYGGGGGGARGGGGDFRGGGLVIGIPGIIGIPGALGGYDDPPPRAYPVIEAPEDDGIEYRHHPPRGQEPIRRHRPPRQAMPRVEKPIKVTAKSPSSKSPLFKLKAPKATASKIVIPPTRPAPSTGAAEPRDVVAVDEPGIVPGEILVTLRPQASSGAAAAIARREQLTLLASQRFTLVATTVYRYRVGDRRSVAAVVRALVADPQVLSAQPNHVFTLTGDAAPSLSGAQYAVTKLHIEDAHRLATGRDIAVAVIDSEVDEGHPALLGAVAEMYDALDSKAPVTAHRHGTAIAGIIAAREPLASAAPAARLLAIRAFADEEGATPSGAEGTTIHILRALDWAAAHGARIVNMSFAGPRDDMLTAFIAAGTARGAIYVAAAGNAGSNSPPLYPAADPNVLAVTATDAEDRLFPAANRGAYICVAAPGVEIFVAMPGGAYGFSSGTSMAAAEVSGIIAMMLQVKPDLSPAAVRAALTSSAGDRGAPGTDAEFGAGLADAQGALKSVTGVAAAGPRTPAPAAQAASSAHTTQP